MSEITRFCLVRHGETPWNAERRIQGQTDIGLNQHGLRQARAAARFLRDEEASALYASDLARAWATAHALGEAAGLAAQPRPALRERRYGVFEGLTYEEAKNAHHDLYERFERREPAFAFPGGGESLEQLHDRVVGCLNELAERHHGETLLLVTHGGVLDIVNRFVRDLPLSTPRDFTIPNAGLNWVSVLNGNWQIDEWAITAHLDAALDEL